ncbi:unnamed protein product [Somion occarium]|uniref:CCHC-type domain-containing protein n=1 Tax=Somion occarium TaxID=3059160 RepID=A0ABP1D5M3_9APHY
MTHGNICYCLLRMMRCPSHSVMTPFTLQFATAGPVPQLPVGTSSPTPQLLPNQAAHECTLFEAVVGLGQCTEHLGNAVLGIANHFTHFQSQLAPAQPAPHPVSQERPSAIQLAKPRVFDGKASSVVSFLQEVHTNITLGKASVPTDAKKIAFMTSYYKDGKPTLWHHSLELSQDPVLGDFEAYLKAFKNRFESPDLVERMMDKVETMTQTCSAAEYSAHFQEALKYLDINELLKIHYFHRGLKEDIKNAWVFCRDKPVIFQKYISESIAIDNHIFQCTRECHFESCHNLGPATCRECERPPAFNINQAPQPSMSSMASNSGIVPMEVDSVQHGPLTAEEKDRHRKEGLCFYCGKGKHQASECPNKTTKPKKGKGQASPSAGKA